MRKTVLALTILGGFLTGGSASAQPPRDTPPPAIENARRERDLRAAIAAGISTKDNYLEIAALLKRQGRYADAIAAFRAAAALEPQSAEAQHRLASFCWDAVQKDSA